MAAAEEEELLPPRLPELFDTCQRLLDEVEVAAEPTGARVVQEKVLKGLHLLKQSAEMLLQLDLFSHNEDLEEIASSDLKYLMVPALQGALALKQVNPSKRLDDLQWAREHFLIYLTQCQHYHVAEFELPKTKNNSAESNTASSSMAHPNLVAMASQRQAKIERYKQKKEMEHRLSAMKAAVESGEADDEHVREYYLLHLRRWISISLEEIDSIDQEIKILREKDAPKEASASGSTPQARPPMKPFILTRNAAQAKVFGAGYPSLASMTVNDWYDQHRKVGALPDQGIPKTTSGAIPIISIIFLVFTKFWALSVLALSWFAYDWKTHSQGGRRLAWVRKWTLWKYFRNYFPIKLVKTHDLSPNHNYIIANHPHGIFSYGVFINFATEATGFAQLFPGITPSLGTLEGIFWWPFVRDYVMSMGVCPVSKLALKYLLTQKGSGNAVVIVVGGAAEALMSQPEVSTIFLKQRKGFVKLALQTGAYLVPSYSFGENDVYKQEAFNEGTWIRVFQNICKKIVGLNFCVFHGRGLTRESWGFLPFNRPITTVVGEPLPIPKIKNPDEKTVDKYHTLYISALRKLFDQHKVQYGLPETQDLTIV